MDDVPAVLDAIGAECPHLITNIGGGMMAMTFAAAHPEPAAGPTRPTREKWWRPWHRMPPPPLTGGFAPA